MKSLIIVLWITLVTYSQLSVADTLTTTNYVVTISQNCDEGNVTCDNVTYHGISRKTGKGITLKGTTKHAKCADGVTPCRFLGYEFKSGNITYLVLESGFLQVSRGKGKVLVAEKGEWTY